MIIEITGLPGNGKTLYALQFVKAWAERENRPVYYSGIADLMLPWTEIDPNKWFECPPNSIILIDECQRVFRSRTQGKEVPEHVARLETHRHDGLDLVLITQHPLLTDISVRRLVGKHFHVMRKFGTQAATIHEWAGIKDTCDKPSGRTDSIKHHWLFNKSLYGVYKSAEVHTVKSHIPRRVFVMFCLPVLAVVMGYYAIQYFRHLGHAETKQSVPGAVAPGAVVGGRGGAFDPVADAKKYVYDQTPRIVALAQSAPKYDELTKPASVPVPAACISTSHSCRCYTQQGTAYPISAGMCADIVAHGYFQEFDPDGGVKKQIDKVAQNEYRPVSPDAVAVPSNVFSLDAGSAAVSSSPVSTPASASPPVLPHLLPVPKPGPKG